jgi:uncharacterized membrane protein (UPF0127 family)
MKTRTGQTAPAGRISRGGLIMILIACFALALVGVWVIARIMGQAETPSGNPPKTVAIGATVFTVDLAADDNARMPGLSRRTSLPADYGMLFMYPRPRSARRAEFWMKDCLMDLDIAFISADRRIVTIYTMKAEPGTPDDKLRRYPPTSDMQFALEVAPGELARRGIKVGDPVTFSPAVEAAIRYATP